MADYTDFVEAEGLIHLVWQEHTLCGDAFDLASDEPGYEWKAATKKCVTCPNCARIINLCRGVRVVLI